MGSETWFWSATSPPVAIPAGSHQLRLWGREDGIKIRTLKLASGQQSVGCYFAAQPALITISANSAVVSSPWVRMQDYVEVPEDSVISANNAIGSVDFAIRCARQADVEFQMETIAPDGNSNSVFIGIGSGDKATWDVAAAPQTWTWVGKLSPSVSVPAGDHLLKLYVREKGIKIRTVKFASGHVSGGCEFHENAVQALEDNVLPNICGVAASEAHCMRRSEEASTLHGIQCAWAGDRCEISTQETACKAVSKEACEELARDTAILDVCVWSGSMCYAFKRPFQGCDFQDPSVCQPNVAIQLASTGDVDPVAQEVFDWNGRTAEVLSGFATDSILDLVSGIPLIGGFLGAAGSIAGELAGTDTSSSLCPNTEDMSTGACLFRYVAEYVHPYVTIRLQNEKIGELQHFVTEARDEFVILQTLIETELGEGRNLDDVTREDFTSETLEQIDDTLRQSQFAMRRSLNNDFMNTLTVYEPNQAIYTAQYATLLFQMWASQIVFDPSRQTDGWVQVMIDEIDSVTEFVVNQMNMAKKYRLDSVGEGVGTYGSRSVYVPQTEEQWYEGADEFPECPWTGPKVTRYELECDRRGISCDWDASFKAEEDARMCLQQRRNWVTWSQDVYWRQALQVHLIAWQDLRKQALEWQKSFHPHN